MPENFPPTQGGASQPGQRQVLCPRERLAPVLAFPAEASSLLRPRGMREVQEGAGAGSVVRGLLSPSLLPRRLH